MVRVIKLLAAISLAAFLATVAGRWVWHGRVDRLIEALSAQPAFDRAGADAAPLPPPVARYLSAAISPGREAVRMVHIDTSGDFYAAGGWKRFRARQQFNTVMPGFVWDARIAVAPFATVFVRDSYVNGRGEMTAHVLAVYPVVNESGTGALAEGQLARYVAEMIWFPTALQPGRGVTWTPIDDHSATAHFNDRGHAISLRFSFNEAGDVVEVFAAQRMRSVNGRHEPTPWAVRCGDHQQRMSFRIPVWCEAEWRLPDGPLPYWRGRVTNIRFE